MSSKREAYGFVLRFAGFWFVVLSGGASAVYAICQEIMQSVREGRWGTIPFWAYAYACVVFVAWVLHQTSKKKISEVENQLEKLNRKELVFPKEGRRARFSIGGKLHYSIAVKNTSTLRTVRNCRVQLQKSVDPTRDWDDIRIANLPAFLHRVGRTSHRDPAGIDLGPQEFAVFDFLRIDPTVGQWDVPVSHDPNGQKVPSGQYEFHLLAIGEDAPSQPHVLVIQPTGGADLDVDFWDKTTQPVS